MYTTEHIINRIYINIQKQQSSGNIMTTYIAQKKKQLKPMGKRCT